ncbi:MAG: redoxin domain-containing protein [Planctomycetales bacterium]|jgi:peroxiredoxin
MTDFNRSFATSRSRTRTVAVTTAVTLAFLLGNAVRTAHVSAAESASQIGKRITTFSAKDFRGRTHTLDEYSDSKVIVLAFLGTECPLAKLYGPRLASISKKYADKGVTILGVNSNRHDSITEISAYARIHEIGFPILKDLDNRIADLVGATRTPEILILDEKRIVRYHGRVDDQYGVGYIRDEPQKPFVTNAIDDLLASRVVKTPATEVVGCFIGRKRTPDPTSAVTFSNQVARILNKHCVECHREGEIAPFSLTSYDEVVGWGDTMLEVIQDGRMPPWHADPKHGDFLNARVMTAKEKSQLRQWVDAGSPEGDRSQLPEQPTYTNGWQLPREPDLVVNMRDQPFDVQAEGTVKYQYFQVDPGFKEDKWVKAAELQPGNRAVVHHILAFVVPPGGRSKEMKSTTGEFLAAYVPGHRAPHYPKGMAKFIPAGSKLAFQLHYTPIGTPQKDLSRLGLTFAKSDEAIEQVIVTQQASNHRGLVIPPNADNFRVEAKSRTAPSDVEILAFMPHMHLRGKSFSYAAHFPDGRKETLLDVPQYDFNWQTAYRVAKPVSLPKGAYLQCVAHFDNSDNNLSNPDPTQTVRWGDQTWNEMMIGYFDVAIPTEVLGLASAKSTSRTTRSTASSNQTKARVLEILKAIRDFDRQGNNNGQLEKSEVPNKHLPIFKILDADKDDVLTAEEVSKTINKLRVKQD